MSDSQPPVLAAATGFRLWRVVLFVALTFALSWGLDLAFLLTTDATAYERLGMSPVQMLVPASVAFVLQRFVFRDSPLYFRRNREPSRWVLNAFLILAVVYGAVTLLALIEEQWRTVLIGVGTVLVTLWVLLVFAMYAKFGEAGFRRVGLQLARKDRALVIAFGIVAYFVVSAGLNLLTGLGEWRGWPDRVYGVPIPGSIVPLGLAVLFVAVTAIGLPLSQIAVVFGEEYGWRGLLQDELVRLGARRGVLLVGVIWGVWHFPVIARGIHTYPPTVLGLLLAVVFFVLWGFVQSFAVIKTGSIWVPAFLHGLVNSTYAFTLTYLVRPYDNILSFGLGLFGLVSLAVVVWWLLGDLVWRGGPATLAGTPIE